MSLLADDEVAKRLQGLRGWTGDAAAIRKVWSFDSFKAAMAFANRVADLAEELDHHPDILVQYNRVTLTSSSHDAGGVTQRDLRLAERIEAL